MGSQLFKPRSVIFSLILAIFSSLHPFCDAAAQGPVLSAVTPKLIASVNAIKPGSKFYIGVHFSIKEPWHIYWKNPGDAGLPTKVELQIPEGFVAGALQWPAPKVFKQPGDLTGYGYEQEVLLFQEVQAPLVLEYGAAQHFKANVRWLGCLHVCVPGRAALELDLPAGDGGAALEKDVFAKWVSYLPSEPSPDSEPFVIKVAEGSMPSEGESSDWRVIIEWASNPSDVTWFPAPDATFNLSEVKTEKQDRVTRIGFKLKRAKGAVQLPSVLNSILSFSSNGLRKAVNLSFKLS